MTPDEFIAKWIANTRNEQAASKEHFLDLCGLLGLPGPNTDAIGANYAFEKGVKKASGSGGWADVWRRGCFGWEYKSRGGDLEKAHDQLLRYAGALENPPLLISSDMVRIVVRTNFNGKVSERFDFNVEDIRNPVTRNKLKTCWTDPDRWMPGTTRQAITEAAAAEFAALAERLRGRGHAPQLVAHFVNRLVFCLFADDVDLLPAGLLTGMLTFATKKPEGFQKAASELFEAMREKDGRIGFVPVQWFNGGLFDDNVALPLNEADIASLSKAAALDWSEIDPSIFGTLFERGLDPSKRSQLGAHYTDREKITILVKAVVVQPLMEKWAAAKAVVSKAMDERATLLARAATEAAADAAVIAASEAVTAASQKARRSLRLAGERRRKKASALLAEAQETYQAFIEKLRCFRVLDPACGSGNFLYMSLLALKDLELRIDIEAEIIGLAPLLPSIGPEAVLGMEINSYAAELARVSVWIGHIQWARKNGYAPPSDPVLRTLDTIECGDAVLNADGTPAEWPKANAIIGNPPFLGDKFMISSLGQLYVDDLRTAYAGRVPGGADLVCYWFEKGRQALEAYNAEHVGFVATNSIRGGANRFVLDRIGESQVIYEAWSDEPWTLDGAAVRVSLVCFARTSSGTCTLNGVAVPAIHSDLTSGAADLTLARPLVENEGRAFSGITKKGAFEIPGDLARKWLAEPSNAAGTFNSEVLSPWVNGEALVNGSKDMWIVNFGERDEGEAAYFSSPYAHLKMKVKPVRAVSGSPSERRDWWKLARRAKAMFDALDGLSRFIVTPEVSKHRVFGWCPSGITPDKNLVAFARDDDTSFGILQSRFHATWAHRLGTSLEDRPRYTSTTTFRTFPFPDGLTPDIPAADYATLTSATKVADAAIALVAARDRWLNPTELCILTPEVISELPDRILPVNASAAETLRSRTLTKLYNTRGTPQGDWLDTLHAALDNAVADAYGWPTTITDDDAMERLLALNMARPMSE